MGRNTLTISHMGGEGATWLGMAGHSGTQHVFANMGDGTYFHSGLLAIRAAVAAGVNITYKLLFNDAVAMTGGQPVDGTLTVPQTHAPARRRGCRTHHRDERRAGEVPGRHRLRPRASTSATATSSTKPSANCAKRPASPPGLRPDLRRREAPPPQARQPSPTPAVRVFINEAVCEGCGDCAPSPTAWPWCRWKPSSAASAPSTSRLQQGLLLPRRLLPEHGHRAWRQRARGRGAWRPGEQDSPPCPSPPCRPGRSLWHPRCRRRRHRRGHHRRPARHGRPPRRQGRHRARHDRPGAKGRRRDVPRAPGRPPGKAALGAHRHRRGRLLLGCDIVVAVSEDALSKTTAGYTQAIINTGAASPANSCAIRTANFPPANGTGDCRHRRPRRDAA
jgi:hypothetical protein